MTSHSRKQAALRALCAELHPDDGVDPRHERRRELASRGKSERKLRQLGKQVARTLQLAFGSLSEADRLSGATITDVVPHPDASRLNVVVTVAAVEQQQAVEAVLAIRKGWLRAEVASVISRRRVPELTFTVRGAGAKDV